jgi:hypothetical protein
MTGNVFKGLALLVLLIPGAIANDRRASSTMTVSVVVASPCLIGVGGQSNAPGCREASRQMLPRTDSATVVPTNSTQAVRPATISSPASDRSSVLLIRF